MPRHPGTSCEREVQIVGVERYQEKRGCVEKLRGEGVATLGRQVDENQQRHADAIGATEDVGAGD